MKLPDEVRGWLAKRYASQHRQWLAAGDTAGWPLRIPLGLPTEAAALRQPSAVRDWSAQWRAWAGPGELAWTERHWKVLGLQRLPQTLLISDPAQAASLAGELDRWQRAAGRAPALRHRWPALAPLLPRLFDMLADFADADFQRLQTLLAWLIAQPASGLYPRQLPLAGMDSKWLEPRIGLVALMLSAILQLPADGVSAHALCGLKRPPATLRLRVLDPALRAHIGGLADISAPVETLADLQWRPATVIIVENLQTGLALQDLPGTVAFMGLGYAVDALASLPWLRQARCVYWGDIDTHGYAILHQARTLLPQLVSVMMDDVTLLRYASLWTTEASQASAEALPGLTADEQVVYTGLRSQRWGQMLRLEQERIAWNDAWQALSAAVN
ncbi:hypothetical protein GTP44_24975 [Duganella sp. FT50W]|uniref:DUF3322 and DUF2220 domain-containing protein n=1 Tax=Duganella lactea TaxID=2692173 RepID=A0A6L8MSW3_9BURK|nr:Wadjet anti-phage system protein JetD domain-containing protein [Duganella lactea]MYM85181.1 hypothetical protein [Duganella lactea]